ncbi:Rne/Rng family ribonuclease [Kineobactrum sediminis]|nr:Rne/Rng family ribonuclease [Kineobactrum sediminis]
MSEQILINMTGSETRVAIVADNALRAVEIERTGSPSLVGNIYLGKVVRVLPGMAAAFIDLGIDSTGFLAARDATPATGGRRDSAPGNIDQHLYPGQKIIVQVTRDAMDGKGPTLTMALTLSSHYLLFRPGGKGVNLSRRINEDEERQRLRQLVAEALAAMGAAGAGGLIVRTAASGAPDEDIRADLHRLLQWRADLAAKAVGPAPKCLYTAPPLALRAVRDYAGPATDCIRIDDPQGLAAVRDYCVATMPALQPRLQYYDDACPLFECFGIERALQSALQREVPLPSGGCIAIDQTEAMTTIDVNTGAHTGQRDPDDTSLHTNTEAASVLAHELRLRNLGGIIIVDFINMQKPGHRRLLQQRLREAMAADPAEHRITGMSGQGLVTITRTRNRDSLAHILCEDCPACAGRGRVKSAETVSLEIIRALLGKARRPGKEGLEVRAAAAVVDRLQAEETASITELSELLGRPITFRVQPGYRQEQFDIVVF